MRIQLALLLWLLFACSFAQCKPREEEFNGPFTSWLDVKRDFHAAGDGKTDDTGALQAALDEAARGTRNSTLFLPAGVYCITRPLTVNYAINISVIGADPKKTTVFWAGRANNSMLRLNGVAYSKFNRIAFEGRGLADAAVDQSWDGKHPYFDTSNEYADDIFKDVNFGIRGGAAGHGFAETSIRRSQFLRCRIAGISLGNFNALDIWINGCYFEDCGTGVTNTLGAGNFKVYHCGFRRSTTADMSMSNTGEFSVRQNTSYGSSRFFVAGFTRNPAPTTIEDNTIIDPNYTDAVTINNQGPVIIEGNTVRSAVNASGPVIRMNADGICYNNTFTVDDPVATGGRNLIQNNRIEALADMKHILLPIPSVPLPTTIRPIIEVPAGSDVAAIQAAIIHAMKLKRRRPVVHLSYGRYTINSTIHIPAGSDLQLVGDGFGDHNSTFLIWSGVQGQPMLQIEGPSRCTLRDFSLKSTDASANILVSHADQPVSLIGLQEFHQIGGQSGLLADRLEHCRIVSWDGAFSGLQSAVKIIGSGNQSVGLVCIYSGATSDNVVTHEVSNGGALYVADEWYEGKIKSTFAMLSGASTFIASGCHIAVPEHSEGIKLAYFTGNALLKSDVISGACVADNNSPGTLIIAGALTEEEPFLFLSGPSKLHVIKVGSRIRNHGSTTFYGGSLKADNIDAYSGDLILETNTPGVHNLDTDDQSGVFIYRVMSIGGNAGLMAQH